MNTLLEQALDRPLNGAGTTAPPWLDRLRRQAADRLAAAGLPDRKVEAWKYTPFTRLAGLDLAGGQDSPRTVETGGNEVRVVDGAVVSLPELPPGLSVMTLQDALGRDDGELQQVLAGLNTEGRDRAFAALNTARLEEGLVIRVAAADDCPGLSLRYEFSKQSGGLANFRLVILVDPGARLRLFEHFESDGEAANGLNTVSQLVLGAGAALDHVRLQSEHDAAVLLSSTQVEQGEDSEYVYTGFDLGGSLVRHEIQARLGHTAAAADIRGAFVLDDKRFCDNHVAVDHAAPGCRSSQLFRGVLGGSSRGVFNGRALIREGSDDSSVQQSNANLLLSRQAEMDTKPELEIYADEVEASHGATVGQLDEAAVFYLRTRGLSEEAARRMLTMAFCHAVTDRLADRELAEDIAARLDRAMPASDMRDAGRTIQS